MTRALHQALDILHMSGTELSQWLLEEIERNPLLQLQGPPLRPLIRTDYEAVAEMTLDDHLRAQIRETFTDRNELELAEALLHQLDEKGFVEPPLPAGCERVLSVLQTFDPPGIFAQDLRECLLNQLDEHDSAYLLVRDHFSDLLKKRFTKIRKIFTAEKLASAMQKLALLSFRPGAAFRSDVAPTLCPDLILFQLEGKWRVMFPEGGLPRIELVHYDLESEEKGQIREWLTAAKWVKQCVQRRKELLMQIGKLLVRKQTSYLLDQGPLHPLTIREAAEELQLHESTLSRAVAGKYVETPRGIFSLRSFFTTSPTQSAKTLILQLVEQEEKPLTDTELAAKLKAQGIALARRTIAKYRKQLKIGSARDRPYSSRRGAPK